MAAIIPGMENINFAPIIAQGMYWLGVLLFSAIIISIMWFGYRMLTFKMKATIFPLYGAGIGGELSVGKPKHNRFKWNKDKTAWLMLKPYFNNKEIEPFDPSLLYPGNQVFAYEIGGEIIPCKHDINIEEANGKLKMVPHAIRAWQSQVHKKNAEKYAKIDFWSENKYLFITLGCVVTCAALCLGTIWLAYKFAQPASSNMAALTSAIKNMNVIQGVAPG